MLKKALSAVISLCMLLSLLPAAFAAPAEVENFYTIPRPDRLYLAIRADEGVNYNIYKKIDGEYEKVELPCVKEVDKAKIYEDTDVVLGTEYEYMVKTVDADGAESEGRTAKGKPFATRDDGYYGMAGWDFKNNGDNYGDVSIVEDGYEGAALRIVNNCQEQANTYTYITTGTDIPAGRYKFSWYEKYGAHHHSWETFGIKARTGLVDGQSGDWWVFPWPSEADGEWHERSVFITFSGGSSAVDFIIQAYVDELFMDKFSLYPVDENDEVIEGSENFFAVCDEAIDNYFAPPAELTDFYVIPRMDSADLIITAPMNSDFNIYRKSDGDFEKLDIQEIRRDTWPDDTFTAVYSDTGLETDTTYEYLVKTVSGTGIESEGLTAAAAVKSDYDKNAIIAGWSVTSNGTNYGDVSVSKEGYERNALRMTFNSGGWQGFTSLEAMAGLSNLEPGKKYKLTWKEKVGNRYDSLDVWTLKATNGVVTTVDPDGNQHVQNGDTPTMMGFYPADGQWHDRVAWVEASNSVVQIRWLVQMDATEVLMDNFELYEADAEGNVIGTENKMAEWNKSVDDYFLPPADVNGFYVMPRADGIELAVREAEGVDYNIYRVADGALQRLELEPVHEIEFVKIYKDTAGLQNGVKYEYVVKAVSPSGIESEGLRDSAVYDTSYNREYTLGAWFAMNNGDNYGGMFISDNGVDGSKALKIVNNQGYMANTFLYITISIPEAEPGRYKLSWQEKTGAHTPEWDTFMVKARGARYDDQENDDHWMSSFPVASDGAWHEKTHYLTDEDGNGMSLDFQLQKYVNELYIDNITLVRVDENGDPIPGAENIFPDGGTFDPTEKIEVNTTIYSYDDEYDVMGWEISALSDLAEFATSSLYAEAEIKNIGSAQEKPFCIALAVYKDGALYEMVTQEVMVPETDMYGDGEKYGIIYKVPDLDGGEYSLKMMVWDSLANMKPFAPAHALSEN